jgi:hypothetical protein
VLEDADSAAELRLRAAQLPPQQLEGAHQGTPSKFSSILATSPSRINGVRQVAVTFPAVRRALRLRRSAASHLIERVPAVEANLRRVAHQVAFADGFDARVCDNRQLEN